MLLCFPLIFDSLNICRQCHSNRLCPAWCLFSTGNSNQWMVGSVRPDDLPQLPRPATALPKVFAGQSTGVTAQLSPCLASSWLQNSTPPAQHLKHNPAFLYQTLSIVSFQTQFGTSSCPLVILSERRNFISSFASLSSWPAIGPTSSFTWFAVLCVLPWSPNSKVHGGTHPIIP